MTLLEHLAKRRNLVRRLIRGARRASPACWSTLSSADTLAELILDVLQPALGAKFACGAARICLQYAACAKNSERLRFFYAVSTQRHAEKNALSLAGMPITLLSAQSHPLICIVKVPWSPKLCVLEGRTP